MVTSNPELRSLLDSNPELNHLLNDPSTLRQAMQLARNPELMREQMRSADRAMANIEGHPEGFNMLRRMYENVQEPLMNATADGAGRTGQNADSDNPFASLFANAGTGRRDTAGQSADAPNTDPLPNPWVAPETAATGRGGLGAGDGAASRPNPFGAMGGMGGMGNAAMNQSPLTQALDSPHIRNMMRTMMSNPAMMESMIASNPQLRQMFDANPQMRQMLQDPAFLESMSNPDTIRAIMNMQREMQQVMGDRDPANLYGMLGGMGGLGGMQTPGLEQLFGGMGGAMGGGATPPAPVQNPEEAYARQLQQLQDMGFYDREENLRALQAASGNVNAAVERLLSGA